MKKIMAVTATAALCTFFLTSNTGAKKVSAASVIACTDYYANDTTPKKHKRKSDTTRRDTTNLAFAFAAPDGR